MRPEDALQQAKAYVRKTADALGAVKGAPCTIKSIEQTDTGQKIIFEWIGNSGVKETSTLELRNGPKGDPGESVSVMVNGIKYEPVNGVINLPDYSTGGGTTDFKYADERPTEAGTIGELVFNNLPAPGAFVGWVYTQFGWLGFGKIEGGSEEPDEPIAPNTFTLSDGSQFLVLDENGNTVPFLFKV